MAEARTAVAVTASEETQAPDAITSREQLDEALKELGALNGLEASLQAQCDRLVSRIMSRYQAKMVVITRSQQTIPIPERRKQLEEAIEAYCAEHRSELLTGSAKNCKLTHGKISWRKAKDQLVELDGGAWEKHVAAAMKLIAVALKRVKLISGVAAEAILRVKVDPDKTAILQHYNAAQLTTAQLKRLGWRVQPGEESISIEPAAVHVENHAEA